MMNPTRSRFVVVGPDIDGGFDVLVIDEANGESDFVTSGTKEFCEHEAERFNAEETARQEEQKQ